MIAPSDYCSLLCLSVCVTHPSPLNHACHGRRVLIFSLAWFSQDAMEVARMAFYKKLLYF